MKELQYFIQKRNLKPVLSLTSYLFSLGYRQKDKLSSIFTVTTLTIPVRTLFSIIVSFVITVPGVPVNHLCPAFTNREITTPEKLMYPCQ
jgi:hypothetical protein